MQSIALNLLLLEREGEGTHVIIFGEAPGGFFAGEPSGVCLYLVAISTLNPKPETLNPKF